MVHSVPDLREGFRFGDGREIHKRGLLGMVLREWEVLLGFLGVDFLFVEEGVGRSVVFGFRTREGC